MKFYDGILIGFISSALTFGIVYLKKKYNKGDGDRKLIEINRFNIPYPASPKKIKKALEKIPDENLERIIECLVACKENNIYQSFSDSSDRAKKMVDRALLK
jgi:hypothetical protein